MMLAAKTRSCAWFYHDSVAKFRFWSGFVHRVQKMFFRVFPRQSWMAGFDMNTHVFQSCLLQLRVNQTHFNVWNKVRDVVLHPIPLLLVSYRNLSWFTQMWWQNMKLSSPGQLRIFLLHPGCLRKHLGCQSCAGGEMEEDVCCFGCVIRMF